MITVAVVLAASVTRTSAEDPVPAMKLAADRPNVFAVGLVAGFEVTPVVVLNPVVVLLLDICYLLLDT